MKLVFSSKKPTSDTHNAKGESIFSGDYFDGISRSPFFLMSDNETNLSSYTNIWEVIVLSTEVLR